MQIGDTVTATKFVYDTCYEESGIVQSINGRLVQVNGDWFDPSVDEVTLVSPVDPITPKQAAFLRRLGYTQDTTAMRKGVASQLINDILRGETDADMGLAY